MSETTEFSIGSEVTCSDGVCGELRRVVVDPVARALTHLVVEPRHQQGTGHLVPIDLVVSTGNEIRLRCTISEFHMLEDAEETELLTGAGAPGAGALGGIGGIGGVGDFGIGGIGMGMGAGPQAIISDLVPEGEVEVCRGERVHATDGPIGRVQGLVVDPTDQQVRHILLDEGHLWGQKTVAIPISAVTSIDDGVQLSLTKDEVRDLPPIDVDHPK